ncbi:hypothetical protein BU24DRAFT_423166 [Aaosphaeria arxii CBS 175.79]|uniref:Uncharacterized protein n=1 Tax=Aaosphaeria arxii CBS 175.79 TaxID=1450172 RepID=A0A6A5XLT7_9PLEO|nr:uncharacterized protein BU24DRAFT_423166 [Aaosphaeria arxii CBS 175.79]KAF2014122.1 hypothetical protein BU24DRAFT_423166 [Aaosphaeria arxii CBS 175.79]
MLQIINPIPVPIPSPPDSGVDTQQPLVSALPPILGPHHQPQPPAPAPSSLFQSIINLLYGVLPHT